MTNPAAPVEVGVYDPPGYAQGVAVARSYAYVAEWDAGLRVVHVADPAAPVEAGAYATPGEAYGLAVAGNFVYIADGSGGLIILRFTGGGQQVYLPLIIR